MKQKEIFAAYLLAERTRLEGEIINLRQRVRYRDVDVVDCIELCLALDRLAAFDEFARNSMAIFHIDVKD